MSHAARRGLIEALFRHQVRFVVIGGIAVAGHGHIRATKDVDLVFDTSLENTQRLVRALDDLGAEVVAADTLPPNGEIAAEWLSAGGHLIFATEKGQLDTMSTTHGLSYDELAETAIETELWEHVPVLICSYENLVILKEAAGRPQDLLDLEALRAIRGESPPEVE